MQYIKHPIIWRMLRRMRVSHFTQNYILVVVGFFGVVLCDSYNLSIIHFNDFHARYEPVDNLSTTCEGDDCIGGFSRLYSKILQLKKENPSSLLLNAGDNFQGTLWYIVHKWNVTQHFLNKLPLDAITLGNHEFDDGIDGLVPFLNYIQAPVVVSNIDDTLEPRMHSLYNKSVVVENKGKKIGIIGLLTTSTKLTSRTENLIFYDESTCANLESQKLQKEEVFTNIVLSHCGYEVDMEIARNSSSKISVIVGGHTDTFLYTGKPVPGPQKPEGPYPTTVLDRNGNTVLVVQASAYTKYLGNLTVFYDDVGRVVGWDGAPIFLRNEIPTDENIDKELAVWKEAVDFEGNKVVGETLVNMLDKPCRFEECPLGNFATDAMRLNYKNVTDTDCENPTIGIIHAGGIRAGIEKGNITFNQLTTTFPFQDTINVCTFKGKHLKEILESCIDDNHLRSPHLFQVSGLRVVYNISRTEGQRVQALKICCGESVVSGCTSIVLEKDYRVFLPTFLTDTSFNPLFQKYIRNKIIGHRDSDVYVKYLHANLPLNSQVEGRINIIR